MQLPSNIRESKYLQVLKEGGLINFTDDKEMLFPGFAKVQVAIRAMQLGEPERLILETLTWQEFEEFIVTVFSFHNFTLRHRFRFSLNRRYEIDVIAIKNHRIFCVDCKQFGARYGKASLLRTASEEQLERTKALANNFASYQVELNCTEWRTAQFIPMLVTMLHEDIIFHNRIPIVPAPLLNAFLLSYEAQLDQLELISASFGRQERLV